MTYIEREPLLKITKELQGNPFGAPLIVRAIENAPTVDVVEVVRCKDCKHRDLFDGCWECDKIYMGVLHDDDFCSRGERRTN